MKNDIKINILNHGKVEIIDDEEFIQKSSNIVYVDDYLEVHKETKGQTIVFKKPRN